MRVDAFFTRGVSLRRLRALIAGWAIIALVAACGGGDDGNSAPAIIPPTNTSGSPGTGGSTSGTSSGASSGNQVPISIDAGVASNIVNMPTVSLTLCVPGTSTCQTIDHVLIDTASFGLRIVASAASSVAGNLPATTVSSGALAECGQFVSSYTWGSVRNADVRIGGELASALPIQMIGDLGAADVPSSCTNGGTSANTVSALGANGILGIGPAPYDCGSNCVSTTTYSTYYVCPNGNASCQLTTAPLAQQVANPIAHFSADNNGFAIALGNPSGGVASGTLTFGIGTSGGDNTLPSSATALATTTAGDITGTFLGRAVDPVFFDSGSNAYFFDVGSDPPSGVSLPTCGGDSSFYCPATPQALTATLSDVNQKQASVSITVQNADTLFASGGYALPDLAGPFGDGGTLDFGLPYFFGRPVYFGLDLRGTGGAAPFVAF